MHRKGVKTWSDAPTPVTEHSVSGFMEEMNESKVTGTVTDLLQLTRARNSRQFMKDASSKELAASASAGALSSGKYNTSARSNSAGNKKVVTAGKRLSSNPSKNAPPSMSYSVMERPPSRVEIEHLEDELSDRLLSVADLAATEMRALETGEMYQPHKDTMMLIKHRMFLEFSMNDETYLAEPWFESFIKCECLRQVCDEVATQMVDMVSVSSTGLGNILRKLKITYQQSYQHMKRSWIHLHDHYVQHDEELTSKRKQVDDMRVDIDKHKKEIRNKVDEEIHELTEGFQAEQKRDKAKIVQTEFQVEQMAETLKSLNGLFKSMQMDQQSVNSADLTFKCQRLENEIEVLSSQVQRFDKLKNCYKVAEERANTLDQSMNAKNEEIVMLQEQLKVKDETIATLTEKESLSALEIEKLQKMVAEQTSHIENAAAAANELEEPPAAVLCIKCKKSLDDLDNIRSAIYGNNAAAGAGERIQCESFRILLPNIKGHSIPHRSVSWLRYAMRNILVSKMQQDVSLLSLHGQILRFPEYSYSWFERIPDDVMQNSHQENGCGEGKPAAVHIQEADDDRWGIYYGAKALAKDDNEAKLFWSLLDEVYGEDGLQFVLYCLSCVLCMGGFELWRQFGNVFKKESCNSYTTAFDSTVNKAKLDVNKSKSVPGEANKDMSPYGNSTIYIDLNTAINATTYIFSKALKAQLQLAIDAIMNLLEIPKVGDPLVLYPTKKNEGAEEMEGDSEPTVEAAPLPATTLNLGKTPPTHICLFTWLRLMLQRYSDDQSHRSAAVSLMFEVASVGALTPAPLVATLHRQKKAPSTDIYGKNNTDAIEFPQFQAVCKTLYPAISVSEIASLFAQTYAFESKRSVTAATFLKIADRNCFFSRALKLQCLPMLAEYSPVKYVKELPNEDAKLEQELAAEAAIDNKNPDGLSDEAKVRSQIGTIIHRRLATFSFGFDELLSQCPEKYRSLLQDSYKAVSQCLQDSIGTSGRVNRDKKKNAGNVPAIEEKDKADKSLFVDGLQPLVHYRRLLATALLVKSLAQNPILPSTMVTGMQYNMLPSLNIRLQKVDKLLNLMEDACQVESGDDSKSATFERARLNVVVRKVQHVFRNFLVVSAPAVCRTVRAYMRPGYLRGVTHVKRRAIVVDPWWAQATIAEIYAYKIVYDCKASRLGKQPINFAGAVASYHYYRWGSLDVSERMIHDLFVCINAYYNCVPRLRLFGAFVGAGGLEEPYASIFQTEEALALYIDLILRVHKEIDLSSKAAAAEGMFSSSTTPTPSDGEKTIERLVYSRVLGVLHIPTLFPSTEKEVFNHHDRKDSWSVEATTLESAAIKWATIAGVKGGGGDISHSTVYGQLVYKLKIDRNRCAEVDDFAWLVMMHWAKTIHAYSEVADTNVKTFMKERPVFSYGKGKETLVDNSNMLFNARNLGNLCESAYAKENKKEPECSNVDAMHAAFLYVNYACVKKESNNTVNDLIQKSAKWDLNCRNEGTGSYNQGESSELLKSGAFCNRFYNCIEPATTILHGIDEQGVLMLYDSDDDVLPLRYMVHIQQGSAIEMSVGMARKSFERFYTSISDMTTRTQWGKLPYDIKTESERLLDLLTRSISRLERLFELTDFKKNPEASMNNYDSVYLRSVWSELNCMYGLVHELTTIVKIPFPQDVCALTRKIHLERSSVFAIQTNVAV